MGEADDTSSKKNSGITSTESTKTVVLVPFPNPKEKVWRINICCLLPASNTEGFRNSTVLLKNDLYFSRSLALSCCIQVSQYLA